MPSRLAVTLRAVNGSLSLPYCPVTNSIWISDDLLHDCIAANPQHQFRRHGSNVPGPLEARKRLSGRKLNNSATRKDIALPASSAPFDISELWSDWGEFEGFGKWRTRAREAWHWQPPSEKVDPYKGEDGHGVIIDPLPSWLADRLPSSSDTLESRGLVKRVVVETRQDARQELRHQEIARNKARREPTLSLVDFSVRLGETKDIKSLRTVYEAAGITASLETASQYSSVAFLHLLDLGGPFTQLLQFLDDGRLNWAEAENFQALVRAYMIETVSPEDYMSLTSMYCKKIAKGVLDVNAVEAVIQHVTRITVDATYSTESDHLLNTLRSFWTALQIRAGTLVDNVRPSIFARLLTHVVGLSTEPKSLALAAEILCATPSLHSMELNTTFKRTLRDLTCLLLEHDLTKTYEGRKSIAALVDVPGLELRLMTVGAILNVLPSTFARSWMESFTRSFVQDEFRDRLGRRRWMQSLERWLSALRCCNHLRASRNDATWNVVYEALAAVTKPKELVPHFVALKNFRSIPFILLRFWFQRNMNLASPRSPVKSSNITTPLFFSGNKRFRKLPYKEGEIFRKFRAHSNRLPPLDMVESNFIARYDRYMADPRFARRAAMFALLDALSTYPREQRATLDFYIELMMKRQRGIVPQLDEFMNTSKRLMSLRRHPASMARYINYASRISPRAALWFFQHNQRQWISPSPELTLRVLKNRNIHPKHAFLLLRRWDPAVAVPLRRRPKRAKNFALSRDRVRVIHNMALTFARIDRYTPKFAFKNIWRLYVYLRKARAPLHRDLSRAMVHAAVIRPMLAGQRVDNNVFRFVLDIVKRLEGDAVADELDMLVWKHRARATVY